MFRGSKGKKGTKVNLTLLRGTNSDKIKVTATRDVINVETVKYKVLENQIGYISISEFDSVTGAQFAKALKQLQKKNIEGLVVDLRNNPGGSLSTVCDILDSILPKGLIVYTKDKNGKKARIVHRMKTPDCRPADVCAGKWSERQAHQRFLPEQYRIMEKLRL